MQPKHFKNPLSDVFDIDDTFIGNEDYTVAPASAAEVPAVVEEEAPLSLADQDIDQKIDTIYNAALDAYQQQTEMLEIIEPKFAARNAEVAAGYLNIALNAALGKARVRADRKRQAGFVPYANGNKGGNTNVIVATREEILRLIDVDGKPAKL